jgi:hypothetical protein
MRTIIVSGIAASLLLALAACNNPIQWNGPGWYLEMPHHTIMGSDWYGGPMSYEDCEAARKKEATADRMLCTRLLTKPDNP